MVTVNSEGRVPGEFRAELLGRWNSFVIILMAAGILGAYIFAWGVIAKDLLTPIGELFSTTLPLGLAVAIFVLLIGVRVVGTSTGTIDVVNLLVTRRIPLNDVAAVSGATGLRIATKSGRLVRSLAYGQSPIGEMIGYPRSKKAALKITRYCSQELAPGVATEDFYSTCLRARDITVASMLGALLMVVTIVINQVRG